MKNILFWLYVALAIILMGLGYTYWQSKVTTSGEEGQAETIHLKNDHLQRAYQTNHSLKVTVISAPYQVSDNNDSVTEELKRTYPSLKINEIMATEDSKQIDPDEIIATKPDAVIMDAMTMNDYAEKISIKAHNKQLSKIVKALKSHKISVYVFGTRPSADDAFNEYQQSEEKYFADSTVYTSQSGSWPTDELKDNYNKDTELLTSRGLDRWFKAIDEEIFKKWDH